MSIDNEISKGQILAGAVYRMCQDFDEDEAIDGVELLLVQVSAEGWREGAEDRKDYVEEINKSKEQS